MREMEGYETSNRRMWLGEKVAWWIRRNICLRSNLGLQKALQKHREMRIISGDNKNRPKKVNDQMSWINSIGRSRIRIRLKAESTLELFFKGWIAVKQTQKLCFHRYSLALNISLDAKQHSGQQQVLRVLASHTFCV